MSHTNGILSILLCLAFQSGICAQQTTGQTEAAEKPNAPAVEQSPANETGPLFLVNKDGKRGYIDKTGRLVIAPRYDDTWLFHDGLAAVKVDGKFGYIDTSGKYVWAPTN
jgi:WG repeat protein